jgi:hypothetical protein
MATDLDTESYLTERSPAALKAPRLEGTWVSRQQGLWVAAYLQIMRSGAPLDLRQNAALDLYAGVRARC